MLDKYKAKNSYKTLHKDLTRLHQKYQQLKAAQQVKNVLRSLWEIHISFHNITVMMIWEKSSCSSAQYTADNIFAPSDNPYLKAEAYRSVAGKLAWELYEANEGKMALEVERNLAVEEKDQVSELLDINLNKLESQKKSVKRTANREAYWNEKCQKLQDNERVENETEILTAEIATLKEQLSLRSNEIKELKQLIDELNIENIQLRNIEEVSLFGENTNSYIPELHACVYSLLDCHVS